MSALDSNLLSCSDIVGDFDVVWLEVFFIAFEKNISGFEFTQRSVCIASSLGLRYFVWICLISVSLLNIGPFHENS